MCALYETVLINRQHIILRMLSERRVRKGKTVIFYIIQFDLTFVFTLGKQ